MPLYGGGCTWRVVKGNGMNIGSSSSSSSSSVASSSSLSIIRDSGSSVAAVKMRAQMPMVMAPTRKFLPGDGQRRRAQDTRCRDSLSAEPGLPQLYGLDIDIMLASQALVSGDV